jgi:hypothetical protein
VLTGHDEPSEPDTWGMNERADEPERRTPGQLERLTSTRLNASRLADEQDDALPPMSSAIRPQRN